MSQVNASLLALFQAHGVESHLEGEWVAFPGRRLRAGAAVVRETKHASALSVQLDVRVEVAPGRTIIESFVGVGQAPEQAVGDALRNFTANSFHVLLAAFFRPGDDEQVSREEWVIGGRKSRVTVGNVGVRGKPPAQGESLVSWFKHFAEKLKHKQLGPGTHWVRLYYAQMGGQATACEVLLDNAAWGEMQSEMAVLDWPAGVDFYSVRVFLVVEADYGDLTTPEDAVARLAEIVAGRAEFSEDEVYAEMAQAGIPDAVADRAYKFTQTAWGRAFLTTFGVHFSPDYLCLNGAGDVVESGRLEEQPYYIAAHRLAAGYATSPGFRRLALMSADAGAINNALQAGSKPENLVTGPAALFMEAPTPAGLEKAQQAIARRMAASRAPSAPASRESTSAKKPWWRLWG